MARKTDMYNFLPFFNFRRENNDRSEYNIKTKAQRRRFSTLSTKVIVLTDRGGGRHRRTE